MTSAVTAMASPPFWRMMPAVASAPALSRSTTTTFAPWRANAADVARPIPLPPPVTSATLPVKSIRPTSKRPRPASGLLPARPGAARLPSAITTSASRRASRCSPARLWARSAARAKGTRASPGSSTRGTSVAGCSRPGCCSRSRARSTCSGRAEPDARSRDTLTPRRQPRPRVRPGSTEPSRATGAAAGGEVGD